VRLRIATLNVWALPAPVGRLVPERMQAIGAALPALEADAVALQEVWRSDAQAALLEAGRRAGYAHGWRPPGPARSGSGLLLLSRHPFLDVRFERYALRGRPERIQHGDWHGRKGFARARLDLPEGAVSLLDTHLHAQYAPDGEDDYFGIRVGQVVQLAAALAGADEPVVAAGDFNLREGRPEYAVLTGLAQLRDTAAELGARQDTSRRAKAYNRDRPGADSRIDYVFVRGGGGRALRPVRVERVFDAEIEVAGRPGAYSDHDGVLAELELATGPGTGPAAPRPDPAALELAARLVAEGRAHAEQRRDARRRWAGAAGSGAVLGLVGGRSTAITRRRGLRLALGAGAALCLPAGLGLLALAEAADSEELAAWRRVEALLAGLG
jgi:endonuclease/exonuclease/phosphatase family metal-dependent hydrolase